MKEPKRIVKKKQPFAKKAILRDNGKERIVYIQEKGSVVSSVSNHPNSSWKTQEDVLTSKLRIFDDEENDSNSYPSNDDNYPQYSITYYNDEGECLGGVLRSE